MNIQITRIAKQFRQMYENEIDMTGIEQTSDKYSSSFNSRCLAAYALEMKTGIVHATAAKCVTDGYNDQGIDAIYKDESEKVLYVVQAKWTQTAQSTISQGDSLKFINGIEKILNLDFSDCNEKLLSKQSEIESAITDIEYKIKMLIIYTSKNACPKETIECVEKLKDRINDECNELLLSEIINLTEIYDSLSNAAANQDIVLNDVLLNDWGVIHDGDTERGYYGMMEASSIAVWWQNHGNNLLAKNIRFFKGDTEVNNGILKCIQENPEEFCYYNNGIKIVAKKITRKLAYSSDRKSGLFTLEGVSIVNGAQTTGSVGKAYTINADVVNKAKIMVQIISLENSTNGFGEMITKLSNTQNKIDNKAFVSMDPYQEKLRRDLLMDGIEYIYKDGDTSAGDKICNIDEVTVSIGCFQDDIGLVTVVKNAIGSIYDDIEKAPYKKIFNPSTNAYLLWNTVRISRTFNKINNEYQRKSNGVNKLTSVHGNRMLLHLVFRELKKRYDFTNEYIEIDSPLIETLTLKYINILVRAKNEMYPDAYPANIYKNIGRSKEIMLYIEKIENEAKSC